MREDVSSGRRLDGAFTVTDDGCAAGHAYDPAAAAALVVEILADGLPIGLARADLPVPGLADAAARWAGFRVRLPEAAIAGASIIDARVATTGEPVGSPVALAEVRPGAAVPVLANVTWTGGLRLTGCLETAAGFGAAVKAFVDGEIVAEVAARGWRRQEAGAGHVVLPSFDIHLPRRFADGRVRHVDVLGPSGARIPGSPCFVVAFEDGLASFIDAQADLESERIRARYADGLLPQSWPLVDYAAYQSRFAVPVQPTGARVAVVFIGDEGLDASLQSLVHSGDTASVAASLPQTGSAVEFLAEELAGFLHAEAADCDAVVFARSGTILHPGALDALAAPLLLDPATPFSHADIAVRSGNRVWPIAFPAFDLERWLEQGYAASLFAVSRGTALSAARRGACSLYRLVNETLQADETRDPVHVPLVLAEIASLADADTGTALAEASNAWLRRQGGPADILPRSSSFGPAVRVRRRDDRSVSVVVATRNRPEPLTALLDSLVGRHGSACETIVVDNASSDIAVRRRLAAFEREGGRHVVLGGPLHLPRLRNAGARAARGDYLLFVDDCVVPEGSWPELLDELVGRMAGPRVGAVGPLIVWPDLIIRSAGLVLGPGCAAAPAFDDRLLGDAGYSGLLDVAHEVSALPGEAMMTRRDLFLDTGGFDAAQFTLAYSDVDYALRLRSEQFRIIVTPDARVTLTRPEILPRAVLGLHEARLAREKTALQTRWGEVLMADPFYSPWLALDGPVYSALSWPPRARAARTNRVAPARAVPSGF